MSFSYFDHEADIGIVGEAETIEKAFEEGAQALLNLIAEGNALENETCIVRVEEWDLVSLWVFFLNSLLLEMDKRACFFAKCEICHITNLRGKHQLEAKLISLVKASAQLKREVKAATFCEVQVANTKHGWRVQCVVDI